MENRVRLLFISLCFTFLLSLLPVPAMASGSFFDTIQSAEDQAAGKAGQFEEKSHTGIDLNEVAPAGDVQFQTTTATSPQQIRVIISNIIQTIIKKIGLVDLGKKITTVFLPPGSSGGTSVNVGKTSTGATVETGKKHGGSEVVVKPPAGNPASATNPIPPTATGSMSLADQLRAYGIEPVDGDTKWTDDEMKDVLAVLPLLPAEFRACTKKIQRDHVFQGNKNVLGYVRMGIPTVYLLDGASKSSSLFQRTLVHEMTHCFQASNKSIGNTWQSTFWSSGKPVPPSVTTYGNSQPLEDMAESVAVYFQNPGYLKSQQPKRYEFIKNYVMGGKEF